MMTSNPTQKIAVIGLGMAGVAFTNAMRNLRLFSDVTTEFKPQLTVFEAMPRVGGKMAPRNMGAQFVDARNFYPVYGPDGLIERLGLKTHPERADYDNCDYVSASGRVVRATRFLECLGILRSSARKLLKLEDWLRLDGRGAVDLIKMHELQGVFSPLDSEAMIARLGFEEGTCRISLLSWAINLAKSESPMPRLEVVGGFYALAEAERMALVKDGHRVFTDAAVTHIHVNDAGVCIQGARAGGEINETFDYVILTLAPEHYRHIAITGSKFPIDVIAHVKPAEITKTNIVCVGASSDASEIATHLFARWHDVGGVTSDESRVNFFHGWEGSPSLTRDEIAAHVFGMLSEDVHSEYQSQTWNGDAVEGTPHAYTTMPAPGEGYGVIKLALESYLTSKYDAERLRLAGQILGLGCYTRDAALSGEWAAIALMRALGLNVTRAYLRDPMKLFTGMNADAVAAQFTDLGAIGEVKKVS